MGPQVKRDVIKESIRGFVENLKFIVSLVGLLFELSVMGSKVPPPRQTSEHKSPENHPMGVMQPPSVRVLNGMVTRQEEEPFTEGKSCQVWVGQLSNSGGENDSGEGVGGGGAGTKTVSVNLAISISLMRLSAGSLEGA